MADAPRTRFCRVEPENLPGGVTVLVLDDPGRSANLLSASVLDEIEAAVNRLEAEPAAGLIVISAKPGMFIAGADLTEFAAGLDQPNEAIIATSRRGQRLFARLATLPLPTVAAIDGICVGGGAELATWCDRRVLSDSPKTQIGFPEVKLGLFPGWGGTARPPRMIGLANAVELVSGGESVAAREAHKLGLADDVVNAERGTANAAESAGARFSELSLPPSAFPLLEAAVAMVRSEHTHQQYLADRRRWSQPIAISETELAFLGATASGVIQQKTGGHYPAPLAALELMLEASQLDLDAALELEAERFAPLFGSPVNRALLNVFFLTDRAKKTESRGGPAARRSRIGVVGAGTMGRGIAAAAARRGVAVTLADSRADALSEGVSAVVTEAAYDRELKGPSATRAAELAGVVDASTDPATLGSADLVVEAIFEDAAAKRELFAKIEPHAGEATILCSNTSTIPIATLAEGLARPDRFCGLHFFNPVRKMPLVEVIRGAQTSDETIAHAAAFARQMGKTPVVVADGPGFLVNRLLMPYLGEATRLVEEGVPIREIEKAAKRFGMPMGPITLQDVVGLDVCLHAGRVMRQAFPDRVLPSPLISALVEAGRLGQKNGRGFFDYPPGKPGKPPKGVESDDVVKLQRAIASKQSATRDPRSELLDRLMLPMLVEATRAVEDGIVRDARDLDLAMILGVGFPPFRGGLLFWADSVGAAAIIEKLKPLAALGKRYEVTGLMAQAAKDDASFYTVLRSSN